MGNVLLISPRNSDLATLVASDQVSTLPVANLQNMQPAKKFRVMATSVSITVALAQAIACNAFALVAHNLSSGATIRVRGAASAAAVTASPVVDVTASAWPTSGVPASPLWPSYLSLVTWSNATALQYWRVDIADAGNPAGYLEAGRLALDAAWQPSNDFDLGGNPLGFDTVDAQIKTPTGRIFTDKRADSAARLFSISFTGNDQVEILGGLAEIQRLRGMWGDVICCLDPSATTNFHLQSMQGVFSAAPKFPIVPQFTPNGVMYGAALQLNELIP